MIPQPTPDRSRGVLPGVPHPVKIEARRWQGWVAGIGFIVILVVLVMAP